MPRPTLPDSLPGILLEINTSRSYSAAGVALLEVGDPSGPPAVVNLVLASNVKTDAFGQDTAEVIATWDAIAPDTTEQADVRQAPVKEYVLRYRVGAAGEYTGNVTTQASAARIEHLPVGKMVFVRVAARTTSGQVGPYAEASIVTAKDTGAPAKPTTPTVATGEYLKSVQVRWDGKVGLGEAPPPDLDHLEVWVATTSPPSAAADGMVGTMDKAERQFTYAAKSYDPHYAQLRAVDRSGNKSPFSDVSAAATPERVVQQDLADTIVLDARAAGTFGGGNGVLNSSFESKAPTGSDANGNATGGGPDPFREWTSVVSATALSTTGFHKPYCARLSRPSGNVALVQSNAIPVSEDGPKVVSAWVRLNVAGMTPRVDLYATDGGTQPVLASTQPPEYALDTAKVGVWQRIATAYASSRLVNHHVRVVLDSGPNGTVDTDAVQYELGDYVTAYAPNVEELTPGSIGPTQIAPGSVTSEKIIAGAIVAGKIQANAIGANEIRAGSITAANAHLADAVVLRAKIADLAVDAAKIAEATITSAKIAEMTAERITTGTLRSTTRITAGVAGGNRIEIDYDGIRLITTQNGYAQVTVALDRATGSGRFQGEITASTITGSTFRTAASGDRVEITSSSRDRMTIYKGTSWVGEVVGTTYPGITLHSAGRIFIGTGSGERVDVAGRRGASSLSCIRAGRINVNAQSAGQTFLDVTWPGGAFPVGVTPTFAVATVEDNETGAPVWCGLSRIANGGCRVHFYARSGERALANRIINIYAEAVIH